MRSRRGLVPALLAPASFGLAAVYAARRVPDYSHRDEPMSALAAKGCAGAPIMLPGFMAMGASTWVLARALDDTAIPRPVPILMRTTSLGVLFAGLARQSDQTCPTRFKGSENVTLSDDLHVFFSIFAFMPWMAMPLITAAFGTRMTP
ncbi:MAG TPA: DUF998 domain-containing protein, partial [Acidimicrobiia bacterium]|nr:DUF998 domain-containing protein [Acidimicrobiia bacterium]